MIKKRKKDRNDSLFHEHKEEMHIGFYNSMDLILRSILSNNNNNNNNNNSPV